jgi:hypothetical protein
VEVHEDQERIAEPRLFRRILLGSLDTYAACQREARRLRARGATAIVAPAAAIQVGRAGGQLVRGLDLVDAPAREGRTLALVGRRPDLRGWLCVEAGRPTARVLAHVNHL